MSEGTPEIEDPLALEHQVCFALSVASRSVIALYRPVLEPLGLTHPQYLVMLALWQFAPLSVKELSALLELEPATLSPLLKRLEASGLVRRERAAEDERRLLISLTPSGRALREQAESIPSRMMERLGMDVSDLLALNTTLNRLISAALSTAPDGAEQRRLGVPGTA
ncbi:MarR family winged helix-turn-helix transcriptional regulator [Nocardiopsis potens]|uniref:MarR family winged helix-turn-helix transcriptional regulator n=1 Tax=Nocardiopsis potens TaxID=1246458 RepID=UPI000370EBEC|nr:MarR family transcriptional regulator [Nocardiopsis potens]